MIQHQITLTQAIDYTTRFRENHGADMPYSETFFGELCKSIIKPAPMSFLSYIFGKKDRQPYL